MDAVLDVVAARLEQPTARGLANAVSRGIRDGALAAGTKLPPIRTVAQRLEMSPTTVSSGWALLARSGTIRTDGRRGTTVTDLHPAGSSRYRRALEGQISFGIDLSTGIPDAALLPDLGPALRSLAPSPMPSSYLDDGVVAELVDLLRADWPYSAEAFTVVDGAMDAIDLIARAELRFGDRVIVEHPCFPPLLDALDAMGVELVGVPVDSDGLDPVALAGALRDPVAAVFLQPRAQNPTGVSMTPERAEHLAALLADSAALVVEDDSAGSVAATPAISLGAWLPDRTLHIRSFSKSHGPDLRLAAVSGTTELIGAVQARRSLGQGWTSRLLQSLLLHLLTDPASIAQVAHARSEYARRRSALAGALAGEGIEVGGTDGINLWVPVHDEAAAIVRLASQGIGVTPGAPFAVLPGQGGHIRVTAGLLADRHAEVGAQLAGAARTRAWTGAR